MQPCRRDRATANVAAAIGPVVQLREGTLCALEAFLQRRADADVRLLACEIARALPAEDASQILEELIERELNTNVCAAAIEVLAETGNSASLPVLTRCASRFPEEPFLAFAINAACDRIGSR